MTTSPIRADALGPYVRTGGYVFRPGAIRGREHSVRMDDAGLVAGDRVKARHKGGTPLAKIVLADGTTTYWAEEATAAKDAVAAPEGAAWRPDGTRDLSHMRTGAQRDALPRTVEALDGNAVIDLFGADR